MSSPKFKPKLPESINLTTLVQGIENLGARINTMEAQILSIEAQMKNFFNAIPARVVNAHALRPTPLVAPPFLGPAPTLSVRFSGTQYDLLQIPDPDVDTLLQAYQIPFTVGEARENRLSKLAAYLGVPV